MSPPNPAFEAFTGGTLRSESDEVYAWLIEINHPDLAEPILISSDRTELLANSDGSIRYDDDGSPFYCTKSKGKTYITHEAFSFIPPGAPQGGAAPTARFVVSWHPEIMKGIADIHEKLTLTGRMVDASDPDTVLAEFPSLLLNAIEAAGGTISAELGIDHFLDEPCGRLRCLPSITPALFKNGVTPA